MAATLSYIKHLMNSVILFC